MSDYERYSRFHFKIPHKRVSKSRDCKITRTTDNILSLIHHLDSCVGTGTGTGFNIRGAIFFLSVLLDLPVSRDPEPTCTESTTGADPESVSVSVVVSTAGGVIV